MKRLYKISAVLCIGALAILSVGAGNDAQAQYFLKKRDDAPKAAPKITPRTAPKNDPPSIYLKDRGGSSTSSSSTLLKQRKPVVTQHQLQPASPPPSLVVRRVPSKDEQEITGNLAEALDGLRRIGGSAAPSIKNQMMQVMGGACDDEDRAVLSQIEDFMSFVGQARTVEDFEKMQPYQQQAQQYFTNKKNVEQMVEIQMRCGFN